MCIRSFLLLVLAALIVFSSCQEDNIVINSGCTGGFPNIGYTKGDLSLIYGDLWFNSSIDIYKSGYFTGRGVVVGTDSLHKTCNISGQLCLNDTLNIDIKYTDTTDNSILKIGIRKNGIFLAGKLWYCDNINNQCSFVQIGEFNGNYSDHWVGFYYSPIFTGSYILKLH